LKSLPLSQTGLHAVERRTKVIVLNHRQALAEVAGRDAFGAFGKISNRAQGWRERGTDGQGHPEAECQRAPDHDEENRFLARQLDHGRQHRADDSEHEQGREHEHV
jgi:hypothetical protein